MRNILFLNLFIFVSIGLFSQDYIACARGEKEWGYINKDGKWLVNPQFSDAKDFSKSLSAVKKGKEWGYINTDGKWVINPQFEKAFDFKFGRARVQKAGDFGWIDPSGSYLINPQFPNAFGFVKSDIFNLEK